MNISDKIRALRDEYIEQGLAPSVYEINNGLCDDFAWTLEKAGFGVSVWQDELEDYTDLTFGEHKQGVEDFFSHCFTYYNGRFYDAECPNGCKHPRDLPLFVNGIKWLKSPAQAKWLQEQVVKNF